MEDRDKQAQAFYNQKERFREIDELERRYGKPHDIVDLPSETFELLSKITKGTPVSKSFDLISKAIKSESLNLHEDETVAKWNAEQKWRAERPEEAAKFDYIRKKLEEQNRVDLRENAEKNIILDKIKSGCQDQPCIRSAEPYSSSYSDLQLSMFANHLAGNIPKKVSLSVSDRNNVKKTKKPPLLQKELKGSASKSVRSPLVLTKDIDGFNEKLSISNRKLMKVELLRIKSNISPAEQCQIVKQNICKLTGVDIVKAEAVYNQLSSDFNGKKSTANDINIQLHNLTEMNDTKIDLKKLSEVSDFLSFMENQVNVPEVKTVTIYARSAIQIHTAIAVLSGQAKGEMSDGQAAAMICSALGNVLPKGSLLGDMATGAAAGAPLGPYGMAAGAVLSLVNHFLGPHNDGPNPTELILQGIQHLSVQIKNLHEAMDTYFSQNFDMQKKIIEVVGKTLNDLNLHLESGFTQIKGNIEGLRSELSAKLDKIEQILLVSNKNQKKSIDELFTQSFRNILACVDSLLKPNMTVSDELFIQRINIVNDGLNFWLRKESFNPLLVGNYNQSITRFSSNNAICILDPKQLANLEIVSSIIDSPHANIKDDVLYANLGFLLNNAANYVSNDVADKLKKLSNSSLTLPHPFIWYLAVEKYIILRETYPRLFTKADDKITEEIISHGSRALTFFKELESDAAFWNGLFKEYQDILKAIEDIYSDFITEFSRNEEKDILNKFSRIHNDGKDENKPQLNSMNFNESPNKYINQFENRSILAINGSIELEGSLKEQLKKEELKQQPLYTLLNSCLPSKLLAAETLGLLHFEAHQNQTLEKVFEQTWVGWNNRPKPLGYWIDIPSQKAITIKFKNLDDNPSTALSLRAEPFLPKTDYWQLPVDLKIKVTEVVKECEVNISPITITFSNKWAELEPMDVNCFTDLTVKQYEHETRAWIDWHRSQEWIRWFENQDKETQSSLLQKRKEQPDAPPKVPLMMNLEEASRQKYIAHLISFIIKHWQSGRINTPSVGDIKVPIEINKIITDLLERYFTNKRTELLEKLFQKKGSNGVEANLINQFHNLLKLLDYRVRLIQIYAYLAGKNLNDEKFKSLITSQKIKDDLNKQIDHVLNWDVPLLSIPCLTKTALDQKNVTTLISFENIEMLPKQPYNIMHPIILISAANQQLLFYRSKRLLALEYYPELMRYINVDAYRKRCYLAQFEAFKHENYMWLKEIFAKDFKEARENLADGILLKYSGPEETSKKYSKNFGKIINWTLLHSLNPSFKEQQILPADKNFNEVIEDTKLRALLIIKLEENNWERNVGLLKQFFSMSELGNDEELKIPYPTMWFEGADCILKIVHNKFLEEILIREKNTTSVDSKIELVKHRISLLADVFAIGKNLQLMIYQVGLSRVFFEKLFKEYKAILLTIAKFIEQTSLTNNQLIPLFNEGTEIAMSQFSDARGNVAVLLDKMNAYGLLINSYINMVFGYQLEQITSFNLLSTQVLSKNEIIKLLQREAEYNPEGTTLSTVWKDFIGLVDSFSDHIFYHIDYACDIVRFKNYLENLPPTQSTSLIVDNRSNALLACGISIDILRLLEQYLIAQTNRITIISLNDIGLDDASLQYLVNVLLNFPTIKGLCLNGAELTVRQLSILRPLMPQLSLLNLARNNLGVGSDWVRYRDQLFEILSLAQLTVLDLSTNELPSDALHIIFDGINNYNELIFLNLSGNPGLIVPANITQLSRLFKKHKSIIELLLANVGINVQALLTLKALNALTEGCQLKKIQLLDLSDNVLLNETPESPLALRYLLNSMVSVQTLRIINTALDTELKMKAMVAILHYGLPSLKMLCCEVDFQISQLELTFKIEKLDSLQQKLNIAEYHYSTGYLSSYATSILYSGISLPQAQKYDDKNTTSLSLTISLNLGLPWLDNILYRLSETIYTKASEVGLYHIPVDSLALSKKSNQLQSRLTIFGASSVPMPVDAAIDNRNAYYSNQTLGY